MLICLLSLVLLQEGSASGETPSQEAPSPPPVPQSGTQDPQPGPQGLGPEAAAKLLAEVAAAQYPAAREGLVDTIDLNVVLKELGEHPREVRFGVYYSRFGGEDLRMVIDDPDRGTRVAKGFSGRDYWLEEGDSPRRLLSGHEYAKDRESIDEAMDLCSDLLLLIDVKHFEKREGPSDLVLAPDGTRILHGDLRRPDGILWKYRLAIPADGLRPVWLEVSHRPEVEEEAVDQQPEEGSSGETAAQEEADAPAGIYQRFVLDYYKDFDGRQVPQRIRMYLDPEEKELARILELHQFQWRSHPGQR